VIGEVEQRHNGETGLISSVLQSTTGTAPLLLISLTDAHSKITPMHTHGTHTITVGICTYSVCHTVIPGKTIET
jgi:hypothetical protein